MMVYNTVNNLQSLIDISIKLMISWYPRAPNLTPSTRPEARNMLEKQLSSDKRYL